MTTKYGTTHRALRKAWAPYVAAGSVTCWRCNQRIKPGEPWDLGHDDDNPTLYRGPEHQHCSRSSGYAIAHRRGFRFRRRPPYGPRPGW